MSSFWSMFGSYPGMYLIQSVLHSAVAAAVADGSILAWKIEDPVLKQRLRLVVIIAPILSFPVYQVIDPERGTLPFRLQALFDSNRWLNLELWGTLPLGILLLGLLVITAVVFIIQELLPIARHTRETGTPPLEADGAEGHPSLIAALEGLPGEKPRVMLIEDEELMLFSTTGKDPAIYLSTGFVNAVGLEELRAAIAHEIAHISRTRTPLLLVAFIFRVIMFFNPVTLIEFRKMAEEEEKICDDMAVSMTKNPEALETALEVLRAIEGHADSEPARLSRAMDALERSSHDLLLKGRIDRLQKKRTEEKAGLLPLAASLIVTLCLNYFIV